MEFDVDVEMDLIRIILPVKICDINEKIKRDGRWEMIKVQWSENDKDDMCELEDKVKSLHPELFSLEVRCMPDKIQERLGVLYRPYE